MTTTRVPGLDADALAALRTRAERWLADDPETAVLGLYLEAAPDGRRLVLGSENTSVRRSIRSPMICASNFPAAV